MGFVVNATPRPLYPGKKKPGTQCIGDWVGPMADWTVAEILAPRLDSIPGPSSP